MVSVYHVYTQYHIESPLPGISNLYQEQGQGLRNPQIQLYQTLMIMIVSLTHIRLSKNCYVFLTCYGAIQSTTVHLQLRALLLIYITCVHNTCGFHKIFMTHNIIHSLQSRRPGNKASAICTAPSPGKTQLDLVLRHQEFTQPRSLEFYPCWHLLLRRK